MSKPTHILQVDSESFSVADLLGFLVLEKGIDIADLAKAFVSIKRLAQSRGAITDNIDIEALLIEWRQDAGLEKASDMQSWMREMGVTDKALRMFCVYIAMEAALSETITDEEITEQANDEVKLEELRDVYIIYFDDIKAATACHQKLVDDPDTFLPTARIQSVEPFSRAQCGYVGRMIKDDLPIEIAESLFAIDPGDIVGPVKTENGALICTSHLVPESELKQEDDLGAIEDLIEEWIEREAYKRVVEREYLIP